MKIHKGTLVFFLLGAILLSVFIGYDYVRSFAIERSPRFTIAYVKDYKSFVREYNNRIEYYYFVNGKRIDAKFRSKDLNPKLKGQLIFVKFSGVFSRWNVPLFEKVLADSLEAPTEGWGVLPEVPMVSQDSLLK